MFPLSCKSAAKTGLTDAKISTVNAFKYIIIFIKIESPRDWTTLFFSP